MTQRISDDRNQVLKVDKCGRVRSTAEQRAAALEEFDRSGLSGLKFAALAGINYQTFVAWLGKRRRAQKAAPVDGEAAALVSNNAMHWVEAVVDPAMKAALRVELPGGVRLEIGSAAQIPLAAQLLKALQSKEGWTC